MLYSRYVFTFQTQGNIPQFRSDFIRTVSDRYLNELMLYDMFLNVDQYLCQVKARQGRPITICEEGDSEVQGKI